MLNCLHIWDIKSLINLTYKGKTNVGLVANEAEHKSSVSNACSLYQLTYIDR